MRDAEFTRCRHRTYLYCALYAAICEVISLFFLGFRWDLTAGLAIGTLTVTFNFGLLERVIYGITGNGKKYRGLILHGLRYALFIVMAWACVCIGIWAAVAYGAGIVGLTVAILIVFGKEGTRN